MENKPEQKMTEEEIALLNKYNKIVDELIELMVKYELSLKELGHFVRTAEEFVNKRVGDLKVVDLMLITDNYSRSLGKEVKEENKEQS